MAHYPVFYKVSFWDDNKTTVEQGILIAEGTVDAMKQLSQHYGEFNIDTVKITLLEESPTLVIQNEATWKELLVTCGGSESL